MIDMRHAAEGQRGQAAEQYGAGNVAVRGDMGETPQDYAPQEGVARYRRRAADWVRIVEQFFAADSGYAPRRQTDHREQAGKWHNDDRRKPRRWRGRPQLDMGRRAKGEQHP